MGRAMWLSAPRLSVGRRLQTIGSFYSKMRGPHFPGIDMRYVVCLLALAVLSGLTGCATTGRDYAYERPPSTDSRDRPMCSSSGNNGVACGAAIVLNSIIHEASK